jgi:hypothetical protein
MIEESGGALVRESVLQIDMLRWARAASVAAGLTSAVEKVERR